MKIILVFSEVWRCRRIILKVQEEFVFNPISTLESCPLLKNGSDFAKEVHVPIDARTC